MDIKTWCCFSQGPSTIHVRFQKNSYYPNEIASAAVHIDNSKCLAGLKNVKMFVEQQINLKAKGMLFGKHEYSHTFKLVEDVSQGCPANG